MKDAIAKQDISVCKKIPNDNLWQSVCIREVAVAKQNATLCNEIHNPNKKRTCVDDIAAAKK